MHVIDYAHWKDSVIYHGCVSDLDGKPCATWSYEKKGKKVTHEQPIDAAGFRALWNGVGKLEVFKRHRVRDMQRIIDLAGFHVIGILFGEGDEIRRHVIMVPTKENDPEFLGWLKTLNVPAGSNTPGPEPAHQATVEQYLQHLGAKLPKKKSRLAAMREKVYAKHFGQAWDLCSDDSGQAPPIDVYMFKPGTNERDYYSLVTSGMSDAPMNVPEGATFRRVELLMYVEKPRQQHVRVLQWLARIPHLQQGMWYGYGTTMSNGQPPEPIFEGSELDNFLFLTSVVGEDDMLHRDLVLDGDPTTLLWVAPITNLECQFIIKRGIDEFLEVLDRNEFPFVLDEARRSYIKAKK